MSRGFNGALMRAFGARDHVGTVREVSWVAEHCVRIRFHSESLFDEVVPGPTTWIRGWFPDEQGKEHQRAYTFSEQHPETGDLALDFVLHQPSGPASTWAARAIPGDQLSMMTMSSVPFEVPEDDRPPGYLLIGDSASLPAINTIIATLAAEIPIEAYLEEHDPADRRLPLNSHPRLRVHWVARQDADSLASALPPRDWSDWYAWVGPESGSLKEIRTRLKEFGFPRAATHAQAYWVQGKSMGKERDPEVDTIAQAPVPAPDGRFAGGDPEPAPAPHHRRSRLSYRHRRSRSSYRRRPRPKTRQRPAVGPSSRHRPAPGAPRVPGASCGP